ncbi:MAG: helix-turn-helix transcriptional regulator [Deltaproteobacteria bacterium]|nr:helix-turn-helix transcriptional regulator [Deltaproteobacteria bacterium]
MDSDTHHPNPIRQVATRSVETYVEWSSTECYPGCRPSQLGLKLFADERFHYTGETACLGPLHFRRFHSEGLAAEYHAVPNTYWRMILPLTGPQAWATPSSPQAVDTSREYLLVAPGAHFSFNCAPAARSTLLIDIDPAYVHGVLDDAIGHPIDTLPAPHGGPHSAIPLRPMQNLLAQWRNSLKRPGETGFSQLLADAISRTLVLTALRDWYPDIRRALRAAPAPDPHHPAVQRAIDFLHDHYTESISLDGLAKAAGINKFGLCRLFRRILGETPIRYLYRIRLHKALELLRGGRQRERSVTEVALSVGFEDLSHFARLFRAQFGITPNAVLQGAF